MSRSQLVLIFVGILGMAVLWRGLERQEDPARARGSEAGLAGAGPNMPGESSPAEGTPAAAGPAVASAAPDAPPPRVVLLEDTSGGSRPGAAAEDPALRPLPFYARMRTAQAPADLRSVAASAESAAAEVGRVWDFPLFADRRHLGRVVRAESLAPGRASFFGVLEDRPGTDFVATFHEDAVAISFSTPGDGLYQIRQAGDGRLTVIELNAEAHPPCATCVSDSHPQPREEALLQARLYAAAYSAQAAEADTSPAGTAYGTFGQQGGDGAGLVFTDVDVMILHTASAEAGAGGASGIAALKDHAIARANAVLANSQVGLRLRLVRSAAVAYAETNNIDLDLDRLTGTSDGFLDAIHADRTAVGADLVTLMTETTGGVAAGLAWLHEGGPSAATFGFNIVQRAGSESTYIHEVGHNFGCQHDRENAGSDPGLYPYAYGHRFTPAGQPQLRTVMAYAPGTRIPYFSNPDISYLGTPTGVPIGQVGEAHNAQVLRNTRAAIAAFRAAAGNSPPTVALTFPASSTSLVANDPLALAATATDADGSIASVRFYQLAGDARWNFTNVLPTTLGSDDSAPFANFITALDAGYHAFAAVAQDNSGAVTAHVVPVTVNPWYRAALLSLPAGYTGGNNTVRALNDSGAVAGTVVNSSSGARRACVWVDTTPVLLEPLAGDAESIARGIAADGRIFGDSVSGAGVNRAVRWPAGGGAAVNLSGLVGGSVVLASAIGVDEADRMLSNSTVPSTRSYRATTVLPLNFRAQAIAGADKVAGYDYSFANSRWEASRWTSGSSGTFLPPLAGGASAWGWSINRDGAVAGITSPSSGWSTSTALATYWPAGSTVPVSLHPAGSTASWAAAVNDHGEVVGSFHDGERRASRWDSVRGTVPLERITMPITSYDLVSAEAINARGQIAVVAWNGSVGRWEGVRMTPVAGFANAYWQRAYFSPAQIAGAGVAGDTDDPDGDQRPNLLERAFGLRPDLAENEAQAVAAGWPEIQRDSVSGRLRISFRRHRAPSDLVYVVETNSNLTSGAWSDVGVELVSRDALDPDWDQVTYQSTTAPAAGSPVFLRVRLSR